MAKHKNRQIWGSTRPSTHRRNAASRHNRNLILSPDFLETRALMAITTVNPGGPFLVNAVEGQVMSGQTVATFKVDDGVTTPANFSALVDWGDGSFSPGSISYNSTNSTYTVTAAHPNPASVAPVNPGPNYQEEGDFTVQLTLNEYATTNQTVPPISTVKVLNDTAHVTDAPLSQSGSIPTAAGVEGTKLTNVALGSFTDTDPGGKLGEYQVFSINWGDGVTDTNGAVSQPVAGGPFQVVGTHTYAEQGSYITSVVVKDVESTNASPPPVGARAQLTLTPPTTVVNGVPTQTPNVTVADAPLGKGPAVTFVATEGTAASGVVANFTDADPAGTPTDFVATINWGDGTPLDTNTTVTSDGKGGFNVNGGHLYKADAGVGPVVVNVYDVSPNGSPVGNTTNRLTTDPTDATVVITTPAKVSPAAVVVTGTNFTGVEQTASPLAAAFSPTDTLTQGNWVGLYGTDGYWIPNDAKNLPSYASTTSLSGTNPYTWASPTSDPRALQLSSNPATRAASTWYTTSQETFTIPITDGKTHQVSLYLLDYDTTTRAETVQLFDSANNPVGAPQSVSNFQNGIYYNFLVSGTEKIVVTNTGPSNAVVSGLFFGSPGSSGVANFIGADFATAGNWQGVYGSGGYYIPNDTGVPDPVPPGYATVTFSGTSPYTWANPTADPRALLQAGSSTARIASTWYTNTTESFGVNITDGKAHAVSLYLMDFDTSSRVQQVQVVDTNTNAVLDTRNVSGVNFHNGEYLSWLLQGNVTIKVTNTGPSNAVASGLFFDGAVGPVIATFTDANPYKPITDFSGTVNWGDGSPVQTFGSVNITQPGGFNTPYQVKLNHFYAEEGTYQPLVTIIDEGGETSANNAAALATATISDAPLTAIAVSVADVNNKAPVEGILGKFLVATFSDSDVLPYNTNDTADYAATINWGDGLPVDTTSFQIVKDVTLAGRFLVYGSHTYAEEGVYNKVQVTVTDTDAGENSASFVPRSASGAVSTATVVNAPISVVPTANPSVSEGQPLTNVALATLTDAGGLEPGNFSEYAVTVNWGDGSPSAADTNGPGGTLQLVLDPVTKAFYTITGSHTYSKQGKFPISVTVVDDAGTAFPASASTTNTGVVTPGTLSVNPGPNGFTFNAVEGANVNVVNSSKVPTTVVGVFTYNDPFALPGDFTANIAWNDGTGVTETGTTAANSPLLISLSGSQFLVTYNGSHAIPEQGTAFPTVTVIGHGLNSSGNSTASISDAPLSAIATPVLTGPEGVALNNVVIGSFKDNDPNGVAGDYTVTVNWGDPTGVNNVQTLTAANFSGTATAWTLKGSHTYAEEGAYVITTTVIDNSANLFSGTPRQLPPNDSPADATVTLTTQANIADLPVTVIPQVFNPVENQPVSYYSPAPPAVVNQAPFVLATFTDADATETDLTAFSATVDWGDGTTTTTGAGVNISLISPGNFQLNGFHQYAEQGSYPVKVTVNDVGGAINTATSTAIVTDAPLALATTTTFGATEGQTYSGQLLTFTDADLAEIASNYAVQINWNDGSPLDTTSGKVTQPGGKGTPFVVSGNHQFFDDGKAGATVKVIDISPNGLPAGGPQRGVNDPTDATLTVTVPGVVQPAPLAITSFPATSAVEGVPTGPVVVGTFTDGSAVKPITDFSGTIQWGDGTTTAFTSANIVPAGPPLTYNIVLSHTFAEESGGPSLTYTTPVLTVYDESNGVTADATAVRTSSVTVADAPLTVVSPTAGSPVVYSGATEGNSTGKQLLAVFTDADTTETNPATFVATITWGDGNANATAPGDITYDPVTKQFSVFGAHTFAETGTYFTSVTVFDTDGGPINPSRSSVDAKSDQFVIGDAPLTNAQPTFAGGITPVEGNVFTLALGTFVDTNPTAPLSDFPSNINNISINWGDGQTTAGFITQPGGVGTPFQVNGTHTYADATPSTYPINVTVTDVDGKSISFATKATVSDAPITSVGAPTNFSIVEGAVSPNWLLATFNDANPSAPLSDFPVSNVVINWGDGQTTTGNNGGTTITISQPGGAGTSIIVSASGHQYLDPPAGGGNYTVTVTLKDVEGSQATATNSTVTVTDAPLTPFGSPLTVHFSASTPPTAGNQTGLALFQDANLTAPVSDYTLSINWGDGNVDSNGSIVKIANGMFQVKGYHSYGTALAGTTRTVTITVTDKDGAPPVVLTATVLVDA